MYGSKNDCARLKFLRWLGLLFGIGICLSVAIPRADAARRGAQLPNATAPVIYVNGRRAQVAAFVDHGRVLVPVRGVFEGIGAEVAYSAPHFIIVHQDGAVIAAFIVGRTRAIAGHRTIFLDAAPMRHDGRVYVPLRIVAEAAGATVAYTSRPAAIRIRQRAPDSVQTASQVDVPSAEAARATEGVQNASMAKWRVGVAVFTGLCALGCLVLTARRFGPALMRPAPAKRSVRPAENEVVALVTPPADSVALTSVEATGEARFHKQLVTETRTIEVPLTREELVIEYGGEGGTVIIEGRPLEAGETVRIPLWEERVSVDVTKHVLLKDDIIVEKRRISAAPTFDRVSEADLPEGSPS